MRMQTEKVRVNWDKLAVDCELHMKRNLMSKRQMARAIGVSHVLFWRFLEGLTLLDADALFSACDVLGKETRDYKLTDANIQLELFGSSDNAARD